MCLAFAFGTGRGQMFLCAEHGCTGSDILRNNRSYIHAFHGERANWMRSCSSGAPSVRTPGPRPGPTIVHPDRGRTSAVRPSWSSGCGTGYPQWRGPHPPGHPTCRLRCRSRRSENDVSQYAGAAMDACRSPIVYVLDCHATMPCHRAAGTRPGLCAMRGRTLGGPA